MAQVRKRRSYTAAMSEGGTLPERGLMVWATAEQAALIVQVARSLRRPLRIVGGPRDQDAAALLAAAREAELIDEAVPPDRASDLRHALSTLSPDRDVDRVLVAARGALEADERAALRTCPVPVVSLEPRPARLPDFLAEPDGDDDVRTPRLTGSAAWRLAADAIAEFGPIRLLEIAMAGRPAEGSVHARLHDAMDVLDRLLTLPAGVTAGMDRGRGDVPEHLAALRGAMAVELRGDDGWCATLACTDAAPVWSRRVTATGDAGRFVLDDAGFTRWGPDGRRLEHLRVGDADDGDDATRSADPATDEDPGTAAIVETIARPAGDPVDRLSRDRRIRLYALCEAARLASRTGERESPGRLIGVFGHVTDG
jgi:hypothetical protein